MDTPAKLEFKIWCNNCDWESFTEEDLELCKDEDGYFKGCPNCLTDGHLADNRY